MPDLHTLALFALASLVVIAVPGPANLYIVARSLEQGRAGGLASVLGIEVGGFIHILGAALGLSALLATSAVAFSVVKLVGAGYLIYLGLHTLFAQGESDVPKEFARQPLGKIFLQAILVEVFNPKAALFILAFVPQFVDPSRGSVASQVTVLGIVYLLIAFASDSMYALLVGSFASWLRSRPAIFRLKRYVSGTIYVALGMATVATGSGKE
ncbi:MAG TPA: LysE family translocator [Thermaerobacter sp.]